jgi:hypothetical protein
MVAGREESFRVVSDSDRAQADPSIIDILRILSPDKRNHVDYHAVRENREIAKHWREMIIFRKVNGQFRMVYWGSKLSEMFGKDLTGEIYTTENYGDDAELLLAMVHRAHESHEIVYSHGNLHDRNGKYINWNAVSLPMTKNGQSDHVLRFVLHQI